MAAQGDGLLSGRVFDAAGARPLPGVRVVVVRLPASELPFRSEQPPSPVAAAITDEEGRYSFSGLFPGRYLLRVERLGYASNRMQVWLDRLGASRLSIGMRAHPIVLHPVSVTGNGGQPFLISEAEEFFPRGARVAAELLRQRTYLQGDVRGISHDELAESVTLGETDLFRTLQRVPGVTARDDYTAVLWTRGALWDETRVYFDGLPLYNPTHAGWLVSSINPDGIGSAYFQPGVRSAAIGEGAAGVLDLRSRRGGRDAKVGGAGEISVASLRFALDGPNPGSEGSWMVAGRRSYLDWITLAARNLTDGEIDHIPYDFADVVARVDQRVWWDQTLEVSGIWEEDRVRGDLPELLLGNRAGWGNRAGRVTLSGPLGWGLKARHTVGVSDFFAQVSPQTGSEGGVQVVPTEPTLRHGIRYLSAGTEIGPVSTAEGAPEWSAGVQMIRRDLHFEGPGNPISLAARPGAIPPIGPEGGNEPVTIDTHQEHVALWGERRWSVGGLAVETGARVEAGPAVRGGGAVRVAPRLTARYQLDPAASVSAGWGRSFQYVQAVGPLGKGFGPELHVSHLWLLANKSTPAIRSDVITAGLEVWMGEAWIGQLNSYARFSGGLATSDPTPGPTTGRPLFVTAGNEAYGVELSARRLAGRWTGSLGYAFGFSHLEAGGYRYPATADQRHALDLYTSYRVMAGLRVGAAYTTGSGKPFTRFVTGDSARVEEPNAGRGPWYSSLDLMVDYGARLGAVDLGAYLQLRNALDQQNSITYVGSQSPCTPRSDKRRPEPCAAPDALQDGFLRGLPRLPVFGVRVAF
ncbi:MAG: TonB-dependent receptor [Longimicrobiaceae bacterium]